MEEKKYKVYKHIFPNGKCYIGITGRNNVESRWGRNGNAYHGQTYIVNAIQKYGWNNIKHEILFDNLTKEEAEHKEIELIALCKSNQKNYGYNIELGGKLTGNKSPQGREILRNKMIINNPMKNRVISSKVSAALTGKHLTEICKNKISENSIRRRKIICLNNGKIFNMITDASKEYNIDKASISKVCSKNRSSVGGYLFAYLEDNNKQIKKNKSIKSVICVETNEIFNSITDAKNKFGYKSVSSISNVLNNRGKTANGYHWKYVRVFKNVE